MLIQIIDQVSTWINTSTIGQGHCLIFVRGHWDLYFQTSAPKLLDTSVKLYVKPLWFENGILFKRWSSLDQDCRHANIWLNPLKKISVPKCQDDDTWVTSIFFFFTERSNLLRGKKFGKYRRRSQVSNTGPLVRWSISVLLLVADSKHKSPSTVFSFCLWFMLSFNVPRNHYRDLLKGLWNNIYSNVGPLVRWSISVLLLVADSKHKSPSTVFSFCLWFMLSFNVPRNHYRDLLKGLWITYTQM